MVSQADSAGNAADIARMVRLVLVPDSVLEVRALGVGRPPLTYAGWFDAARKMVAAITEGVGHKPRGIYTTLNPVRSELLARRANRIGVADRDLSLTSDADILRRCWLPLDFDPERPSGICSTADEHERALARAREAESWLAGRGWPPPVRADSGNGAHLLYRIDLPNGPDARQLLEGVLQALAGRFGDNGIAVDTKVFNAARIWRVYGTLNAKGDNTAERPHRLARLLHVPRELVPVPRPLVEALADEAPSPTRPATRSRAPRQPFDVDAFLERHDIAAKKSQWKDGTRWVLEQCPISDAHTDGGYIVQFANGAITAGCHHNSCDWDWRRLREKFEPGAAAPTANAARTRERGGTRGSGSREERQVLGPITMRLSDVTAKPINWVWRGRVAVGELTIAIGDPGEGKGLISADLAAKITRGDPLPGDPEQPGEPATVVVLSGEDNPETVIRPRYEAAGTVLERVVLVPGKLVLHHGEDDDGPGEEREEPIFLTDLEPLRKVLTDHAPRLLVIDPLQQYLDPHTDSRRANQTRPILESLMKLAREFDVAVLALYHMNKDSGQTKAMYRALDSIDIPAAARLMLLVGHDPDEETKRAVVAVKSNLSRKPEALGFAIEAQSDDDVPTIAWTGPTDLTQEAILGGGRSPGGDKSAKLDEAVGWLLDLLRPLGEPGMPPGEVQAAGKEAGISKRTLERAKKKAGVIARRRKKDEDGDGDWLWTSWTHCWSCRTELCVEDHERCPVCHWLRCGCGQCQKGCDGVQAEDESAEADGRSLWGTTNGRGPKQDRQPPAETANTPGDLAALPHTVDGQGLATPPSGSAFGGLDGDGAAVPVQEPLPGTEAGDGASPTAAGAGLAGSQDRHADTKTAKYEEGWRCGHPLAPNASDQGRQMPGGNGEVGGVAPAGTDASPATASPDPANGDDLEDVTI